MLNKYFSSIFFSPFFSFTCFSPEWAWQSEISVLRRGLSQQTLKTLLLHQGRKRREQTTRENSEREWRRTQSSTTNTGLLKMSGTKSTGRRGVTKLFCTTGSCRKYVCRSIGKGWRRRISLTNAPRHHRHGKKTVNCQAEKQRKETTAKRKHEP